MKTSKDSKNPFSENIKVIFLFFWYLIKSIKKFVFSMMNNDKPVYFMIETNQDEITENKLSILEMFVIEGCQNSLNKSTLTYYSKINCNMNFFRNFKKVQNLNSSHQNI